MASEDRWERIGALFEAALDQPLEDRSAWLDRAAGDDPELLREVAEMLAAHAKAEGVLERSLHPLASVALEAEEIGGLQGELGPYRLVREIGRGGMGVVYQAHDPRLERPVALKFLPGHLASDPEARARFLAEAKAASVLDHPSICTVYDVGESADGRHYIAMAFYEGETLDRKIERGPLPVEEALEIGARVAEGLGRAHEAGIVHRDIKPSNIMVTARGEVKILDFGVAKLKGSGGLTRPGTKVGTFAYMSPEQARGEEVDPRADVWALGCLLYEMLGGVRAFPAVGEAAVLEAIVGQDPVPLGKLRRGLPEELTAVVARALAKVPAERHASTTELLAELGPLLNRATQPHTPVEARPPVKLPAPLTSFLGRERELQEVRAHVGRARLVTLTGPAGTGKTRLALQAAATLDGDFPDGLYFVPLAAIRDPSLVPPAIAHAVGVQEGIGTPAAAALVEALRDRRLLLLLDNFEQVIAAAPTVAELLSGCPEVKALITSRVVLRLSGEQTVDIPPLELPDAGAAAAPGELGRYSAAALFLDRARTVRPDLELDAPGLKAVAEICIRLEGMPLAIELAAARIKRFSPQALLARLGARLEILKAGPRDSPTRHRTLRNAIAWSYDLLSPPQAALFRRLSLFVGSQGFTLADAADAAAWPAPVAIDAEEGVTALLDQSLVREAGGGGSEPRFLMLETIRELGVERLEEAAEAEEARRGHGRRFLALAREAAGELTGPRQRQWLDRLEAERGNLWAALDWAERLGEAAAGLAMAAGLWRFWLVRGGAEEGRRRLGRLLDLPGAATPSKERAEALHGAATLAHNQGDNEAARRSMEEALDLWRRLGDRQGAAGALINLGWVACELSDLETAQTLSQEGLALSRELGDRRGVALALNNLGWVASYRGEPLLAEALHRESLDLRREVGDQRGIAFALANLAWNAHAAGDYPRSLALLGEAREMLQALGDRVLLGWTATLAGQLALEQGDVAAGEADLEGSLRLCREGGNPSVLAWALSVLGRMKAERGDLTAARQLLEESLDLWRGTGTGWGVAGALAGLGEAAQRAGDLGAAATLYRDSLRLRREIGDLAGEAECREALGALALESGAPAEAAAELAAAAELRRATGTPVPALRWDRHQACVEALRDVPGESTPPGPPAGA